MKCIHQNACPNVMLGIFICKADMTTNNQSPPRYCKTYFTAKLLQFDTLRLKDLPFFDRVLKFSVTKCCIMASTDPLTPFVFLHQSWKHTEDKKLNYLLVRLSDFLGLTKLYVLFGLVWSITAHRDSACDGKPTKKGKTRTRFLGLDKPYGKVEAPWHFPQPRERPQPPKKDTCLFAGLAITHLPNMRRAEFKYGYK